MSNVADQIATHSADAAVAQEATEAGSSKRTSTPFIFKFSVFWLVFLVIVTILGGVSLITAHLANIRCCTSCRAA